MIVIIICMQNKWCTNVIARHPMNDTHPAPEQQSLPLGQLPQVIYWARCHTAWNIPPASWGQVSPPHPLPPSVHLAGQGSARSWKVPDCPATTNNISKLSTLFSSQTQNTALRQLPGRKFTLSQPKPGYYDTKIWHHLKIPEKQKHEVFQDPEEAEDGWDADPRGSRTAGGFYLTMNNTTE